MRDLLEIGGIITIKIFMIGIILFGIMIDHED